MAATLAEMADGLEAALGGVSGLRVYDHVPDVFATPCAFVMPESVDYWNAFRGGDVQAEWTVTVVVGRTANRAAQKSLYAYLSYSGDQSIRAALESNRTLGGKVQTMIVESASNMRIISQGDSDYLAADFRCRIHG